MARKPKTPRARAKRKGVSYGEKLSILRKLSKEFDGQKFARALKSRPRSENGKRAKRALRAKVNRTFSRVKPYVNRGFKWVAPSNKQHFETLRKHAGVARFKGMRAIPVPTQAKRLSVRFDRNGRPIVREDGVREKIFLFPEAPKPHTVAGPLGVPKFLDAQDHAVSMLREMLPEMPQGFYIFQTRHHFLIPLIEERDRLETALRAFYSAYGGSPGFLALLKGFKWIGDSEEIVFQRRKEMESERERLKGIRKRRRLSKALREVIAMDRQLKSGRPLSRGQISRRAKITGRR